MPNDPKSNKITEAIASKSTKNKEIAKDSKLIAEMTTNHQHILKRRGQ